MSYDITVSAEPDLPWQSNAKLVSACSLFNSVLPVTSIRLIRVGVSDPPTYDFKVDFLDGRTFRSKLTADIPSDPMIDIGYNCNVFRSSEQGLIRELRKAISDLLQSHPGLTEVRWQKLA